MTEPVAYMWKTAGGNVLGFQEYKENTPYPGYATPLYTSEQLHPRVKMTQAEFDDWHELYECNTLFSSAMALLDDDEEVEKYHNIYMKIYKGKDELNIKNEVVFAKLWANYNPEIPEETIEIVPNMKWFVRRILPNAGGNMLYCTDEGELTYNHNKEYATQFDTKEEAEKWTNPLTEAVQLPVEEE